MDVDTNPAEIIRYSYDSNGWNLKEPNLILSVVGSIERYTSKGDRIFNSIKSRTRNAFKRGLIKAASTTGAWIITSGTNSGVSKLVSEAVSDEAKTNNNLTLIGIVQWGMVANREKLIVSSKGV